MAKVRMDKGRGVIKNEVVKIENRAVMNGQIQAGERFLCVNQCPMHPSFLTLSIDDSNGGARILGSKCCGYSERIISWGLTPDRIDTIIEQLHIAKDGG